LGVVFSVYTVLLDWYDGTVCFGASLFWTEVMVGSGVRFFLSGLAAVGFLFTASAQDVVFFTKLSGFGE